MPKGIYIHKSRPCSELTKIKIGKGNKGKKLSRETREKIRLAQIGKKMPEQVKSKISEALKGKIPKNIFRKGHKTTDEIKEKISHSLFGHKLSEETKKKISMSLKGKKQTNETREKRSQAIKGEKCYNWKGGLTQKNLLIRNSLEYRLWRESVYKRDNYTCRFCNKKGGNLEAHHLWEFSKYPELRFAINNGITLCKKCHNKTKIRK